MSSPKRIAYLPILAGLVVLAITVPSTASAKGPTDARVDGPHLSAPIELDWGSDETDLAGLIDATGFWQLGEAASLDQPAGELGPRYVISYSVHDEAGAAATLALHTYPFAQPDPLVYVPAGQVAPIGAVPEGWRSASGALPAWFEGRRQTPTAAASSDTAPAVAAASVPSDEPDRAWLLVAIAGAVVAVAAAFATRTARRRVVVP